MARKNLELELKVGLFVAIGTGLIMLAILVLGGADSIFSRYNTYVVHAPSVDGLIGGAKVMLGGINVGSVTDIDFDESSRDVKISLKVARRYGRFIRKDSQAEITTQGVLGDKYIALNAGTPDAEEITSGSEISLRASKDLSQFLGKGDQLMVTLNRIGSSLDRILGQFESGNRSETFFSGMASTAKNLSQATDKLNKELDQMKLKSAIGRLDAILAKVDNGTGTLGALVNDPQLYYDARALLGGANRNRIMRNLVRQTIRDGESAESNEAAKAKQAP